MRIQGKFIKRKTRHIIVKGCIFMKITVSQLFIEHHQHFHRCRQIGMKKETAESNFIFLAEKLLNYLQVLTDH